MDEIYEIPFSIEQLFEDVYESDGYQSYRIIEYTEGLDMDNNQSMAYFIECVGINEEYIIDNLGTQITLRHPKYKKQIVIDAGGLGDFFSHSFECNWQEEVENEIFNCANCGLPIDNAEDYVCSGGCAQEMHERTLFD